MIISVLSWRAVIQRRALLERSQPSEWPRFGTVVFLSHLCRARFFAHICGKKRERASSSHLDLWLRILGSTSAFATCQAILLVRNFVEVLVELEFLKSIHIWVGNQGSTVCTLGDDTVVAVKKTALEKIEALCGGARARARILFSFLSII